MHTRFTHLGMDALNEQSRRTLKAMARSRFTSSLRSAMAGYFDGIRIELERAAGVIAEIQTMMEAMYRKFSEEHGLRLAGPQRFSLFRYQKEFDRLARSYNTQFDTLGTMLTNEKLTVMHRFFETLASQVRPGLPGSGIRSPAPLDPSRTPPPTNSTTVRIAHHAPTMVNSVFFMTRSPPPQEPRQGSAQNARAISGTSSPPPSR